MTWLEFKNAVKAAMTAQTPDDDTFAQAVALYVKAAITREVDHDLLARRSYLDEFDLARIALSGYTPVNLALGSTLDTRVRSLLTVDGTREGLSTFITLQINIAYQLLTSYAVKLDQTIRAGVLDMQTYIPCYSSQNSTVFSLADVVDTNGTSRGRLPPEGRIKQAVLIESVDALAASTTYEVTDFVVSNTRVYRCRAAGTTPADITAGLVKTDGTGETLGSAVFIFISFTSALETTMLTIPFSSLSALARAPDDCCSRSAPPLICIDKESYSFYCWPRILDSTRQYRLIWDSVYSDFDDGDTVPFDDGMVDALKEWTLAEAASVLNTSPRDAQRHRSAYESLRQRLYINCGDRQKIDT